MSTIKISELTEISHLNSNTSNTIFVGVDIPSGVTAKVDATTIAEGLYSFNPLNVGNNRILFPGTVSQFSGNNENYLQVNLQNFTSNGTGDYVVTADIGSDIENYVDLGITNSTYDPLSPYNSLGTAIEPLSSYLYAKGNSVGGGNLVIGSITDGSDIKFIAGGVNAQNVSIKITSSGLTLNTGRSIIFSDGSYQSTSAMSADFSQSSFNKANTASGNTVYLLGALNQTNTNITSSNTQLKSYTDGAIGSANTQLKSYTDGKFLANTTGTFGGNLYIAGSANITSILTIANSSYDYTNTALVKIVGSTVSQTPTGSGYMLHITGVNNTPSRVVNDAFGTNAFALFGGRKSNGTVTSPTAVANNDVISRFASSGHNGTSFVVGGQSRIDFVASEDYSIANTGTKIEFWNTPNKSNTITKIAAFNATSAEFAGVVNPQKGFIYSPNVISGIINSLSIDIANSCLYKFECNNNVTMSLNNFQWGKVVEVWLKNTDNNNHSVTHGCQANNSTTGSTSFTLTAGHSAYLRYFSIDGDLANTYVSINYS